LSTNTAGESACDDDDARTDAVDDDVNAARAARATALAALAALARSINDLIDVRRIIAVVDGRRRTRDDERVAISRSPVAAAQPRHTATRLIS
jgi:hypothetical protein